MFSLFEIIRNVPKKKWDQYGEYALGAATIAYEASQSRRPVLEATIGTIEFLGRQLIRADPRLKTMGWQIAALGTTLDVIYAKNRWSAFAGNIASYSTAYTLRNYPGTPALATELGANILARTIVKSLTARNKALNSIKGHDAGHWGREQTFVSGDFEPGSSVKDLFKFVSKKFSIVGSRISTLYRGLEGTKTTAKTLNLIKNLDVGNVAFGSGIFTGLAGTPGALSAEITTANISLRTVASYNAQKVKEILEVARKRLSGSLKISKRSRNWVQIRAIVDPLVGLSKESKTVEEFVRRTGVTLAKAPSSSMPAKYFNPGSERTIDFGAMRRVTILPSPEALAKRGYDVEKYADLYSGAAVHGKLESNYAINEKFFKEYTHFDPDVLRGQGYFHQQTGLDLDSLGEMYRTRRDWKYIREGWKYGAKSDKILANQGKRMIEKKLQQQITAEEASGLSFKLNAQRTQSHGIQTRARERIY